MEDISKGGDRAGSSSGAHVEGQDEDQTVVAATEEDVDMEVFSPVDRVRLRPWLILAS